MFKIKCPWNLRKLTDSHKMFHLKADAASELPSNTTLFPFNL